MGNNELRRKETVEVNWRKSSSKSQDSSSKSYVEKMKEYIGPAYAGVWKAAEATMKGATAVFAVQSGFGINTVNLRSKGGKKRQESSNAGIMPESKKKKELSDVQITANGCRRQGM